MLILSPKSVVVHHDKNTGKLTFVFDFDPAEPAPWGDPVGVVWCTNCFPENGEHGAAELDELFERIRDQLQPGLDAWRFGRIQAGAATVDKAGALAILGVGNTRRVELEREGRFPRPLTMGTRVLWLEAEVHEAKAKIVADDSSEARQRNVRNRHERRKVRAVG